MSRAKSVGRWACALIAALSVMGTCVGAGAAETGGPSKEAQSARNFKLDLFSPTAPAFIVLGVSPRRTADPGAPREFGVDVANLSEGDEYKLGLALSTMPFWWGHGALTIKSYQDQTSYLQRVAARTQMSLGLAYANAKPKSYYNFALGFQTQLLDRQDERFDNATYACLAKEWNELSRPANEKANEKVLEALEKNENLSEAEQKKIRDDALAKYSNGKFPKARERCQDKASARALGKASLMVGAGLNTRTADTSFDGFGYDGVSFWGTYRQPLVKDGFVSLQIFTRVSFDQTLGFTKGGVTTLAKGDEQIGGVGLALERVHWKSDVALSYIANDFSSSLLPNDDYGEVAVRGAVKVLDWLWLQASLGKDFGRRYNEDVFFGFNAHVNWDDLRRRL